MKYDLEVWDTTKHSNFDLLMTPQSKTLRKIYDASFYVSKFTIYNVLSFQFFLASPTY